MLGQEADPAWEWWQRVRWENMPTGRQSMHHTKALVLCWHSLVASSYQWALVHQPQPSTVPILPYLQCNCALKLTQSCQKWSSHVPCQPPAPAPPCLHPQDFLPPFSQPTLAIFSFISFKEKFYNLTLSNAVEWCLSALEQRHKPSCWTMHTADTSPASCESCQAVTALTQTRLIFSFTFLLIHR